VLTRISKGDARGLRRQSFKLMLNPAATVNTTSSKAMLKRQSNIRRVSAGLSIREAKRFNAVRMERNGVQHFLSVKKGFQ
jgi:hypothetical protein